jgi:hypothetical protein
MKKLLFAVLFLACEPIINVSTDIAFNVRQNGFIKASLVTGFDHKYDSCTLLIDDHKNGTQVKVENNVPVFSNISLSEGQYGFSISTPDPHEIQFYMDFLAYDTDVTVIKGTNNIVLNAETNQSLILVDKNSVDAAPTVKGLVMELPMQLSGEYYFAYIKNNIDLTFTIGGVQSSKFLPVQPQTIYVFAPNLGNIGIDDPFIHVINV